jgi:hypothetical protein
MQLWCPDSLVCWHGRQWRAHSVFWVTEFCAKPCRLAFLPKHHAFALILMSRHLRHHRMGALAGDRLPRTPHHRSQNATVTANKATETVTDNAGPAAWRPMLDSNKLCLRHMVCLSHAPSAQQHALPCSAQHTDAHTSTLRQEH